MVAIESNPLEKFGSTSQERLDNAFKHLQNGKGIILTDDKDRENEGDLIFSAHNLST